jgi:uncharacterized RDD family membrane protein YckC
MREAIDPSEILVGQVDPESARFSERMRRADPWGRFLGRFVDYSLFFTLVWAVGKGLGFSPVRQEGIESLIPFEYFAWIPFEAALLAMWATTPGKWLMGIRVKKRGKRLTFLEALRRASSAWFRGLGMGIPILNFFCLAVAYQRFKLFQITSWDREDHLSVEQRPIPQWRYVLGAGLAVFGLLFYYAGHARLF